MYENPFARKKEYTKYQWKRYFTIRNKARYLAKSWILFYIFYGYSDSEILDIDSKLHADFCKERDLIEKREEEIALEECNILDCDIYSIYYR